MSAANIIVPSKDSVLLPPQSDVRPTLVLDLDETLVHCSLTDFKYCSTSFVLSGNGGQISSSVPQACEGTQVYASFRPHLLEFMEICAANFEVVLFTASEVSPSQLCLNLWF